jgi:hypothetical protein
MGSAARLSASLLLVFLPAGVALCVSACGFLVGISDLPGLPDASPDTAVDSGSDVTQDAVTDSSPLDRTTVPDTSSGDASMGLDGLPGQDGTLDTGPAEGGTADSDHAGG